MPNLHTGEIVVCTPSHFFSFLFFCFLFFSSSLLLSSLLLLFSSSSSPLLLLLFSSSPLLFFSSSPLFFFSLLLFSSSSLLFSSLPILELCTPICSFNFLLIISCNSPPIFSCLLIFVNLFLFHSQFCSTPVCPAYVLSYCRLHFPSFPFLFFSPISNPILVNTSSLHPSTVCVPISFNITGPDLSLAILPEILLIPPVIKDNTLAKGSQTHDVYIIKDGKIYVDNNSNNDDNDIETSSLSHIIRQTMTYIPIK